jgi:DNA-binding transcriptional MocR family regulator
MQELSGIQSMQFWRSRLHRGHGPLYLAIADSIGAAIDAGELHAGDRLPPQRQLAVALQADLTTITRAYAEARRRGLIDATVGRGTFVRQPVAPRQAETSPSPLVDMSMNMPPLPSSPSLRQMLGEGLAAVLREADLTSLMAYHLGAGSREDRAAGAAWLVPVLGEVDPARVLVCAGVQCAITALLGLLTRPGDVILTEPLTYPRFRAAAAQFGIRLSSVAADGEGLLPGALDLACRDLAPKAIYCTPTIHNPTTASMSPARRHAIAEVMLRHGVHLIEDDAYGMLPHEALPAIATLAPAVTYYLATLSKCLSPGLRIAHAVAPDRDAAARLEAALLATSLMPPPLMTALVSRWIRTGDAMRLRDGVRDEIAARQQVARDELPVGSFLAHPEGPHVWLTLPAHWHRIAFTTHVQALGLGVAPSDAFAVAEPAPNAVRISLGPASSQDALRAALRSVAGVLRADVNPAFRDIV